MSLQTRLSLAFTLIAVMSVVVTLLIALPIYDRQANNSADDYLALSAKAAQAIIAQDAVRVQADAEALAGRGGIKSSFGLDGGGYLRRSLPGIRQQLRVDHLAVANPDGTVLGQDPPSDQNNIAGYAAFASALDRFLSTGIEQDEHARLWLRAAAPVVVNDQLVGVVATGSLLDSRVTAQLQAATGLEVALVSNQQVQASTFDSQQSGENESALVDPQAMREAGERRMLFTARQVAGTEYKMVYAPLEGAVNKVVGIIVMGMPASRLEAVQNEVYLPVLLVVMVILAGVWALGSRVAKSISNPVQSVAAEMTGYDHKVSLQNGTTPQSGSEANRIADAFHDLQNRLELLQETFSDEHKVMESIFHRLASGTILTDPAFNPVLVKVGQLEIDQTEHRVRMQSCEVVLTPTEFDLLWLLALNAGKVFSREELIDQIWGSDYAAEPSMIDVHVSNLRRKVEPDPAKPEYILTVRGVGYRMRKPNDLGSNSKTPP